MGEEEVQEYHAATHRRLRRRRLLPECEGGKCMAGTLEGNTMPLGYFFVRVQLGTPGQTFTVIVDTGSSLMAVPCHGCQNCGKHISSYFEPLKSSTFSYGSCSALQHCQSCEGGHCQYRTHFVEGSSISGYMVQDQFATVVKSGKGPGFTAPAMWGCQQSETGLRVLALWLYGDALRARAAAGAP